MTGGEEARGGEVRWESAGGGGGVRWESAESDKILTISYHFGLLE